jgi:colicin import membrane protein
MEEEEKKEEEHRKEEQREKAVKEREARIRETLEAEFSVRLERATVQQREEIDLKEQERLEAVQGRHRKALAAAVMEAKNEANMTISVIQKAAVLEKAKLLSEQQENMKQLEEEWRMKEERLQQGLVEVEEREGRWQEERGEVLQEVQRLKAEAGRMVAILAMEAEEENISEERKLSLGQEVGKVKQIFCQWPNKQPS